MADDGRIVDVEDVIASAVTEAGGDTDDDSVTQETDTGTDGDGGSETGTQTDGETDQKGSGDDDAASEGDDKEKGKKASEKPAEGDDDLFAKEHDIASKDKKGRENRIPYSRVVKITANAKRKLLEGAGLTVPADADDTMLGETLKATVGRVPVLEGEVEEYRQAMEHVRAGSDMMENEPEKFLQRLPLVNPKYAELLAGKGTVQAPSPDENMPEPDYDMGNGQKTYSPDGLRKLLQWNSEQTRKQLSGEFDEKIKPFATERQQRESRQAAGQKAQARVEHARQHWPGFKDHEEEILIELTNDTTEATRLRRPMISFEEAYVRVINRKRDAEITTLKADRQKIREELLTEMREQGQVTGTAASGKADVAKEKGAVKKAADPILAEIEKAVAGASQ